MRVGPLLAHRPLTFDDGVYGATVVDMRHGLLPYRDLFSSQGPLHYPLMYLGDLVGLRMTNAPRVVPVLSGVFLTLAVWASARRLGASAAAALGVGVVVATTGSMLWTTGPISGDGPAAAFAAGAVWAALRYRAQPAGEMRCWPASCSARRWRRSSSSHRR